MKMFNTIEIETPELEIDRENIEFYLPSVSQEGLVQNAIANIQYVFGSLLDVFKQLSVERSTENDDTLQAVLSDIKKGVLLIKKFPDQSAVPLKLNALGTSVIAVQPGFSSDLASYIPDLIKTCQWAEKTVLNEIEKFNTIVANFITNKDYRKSSNSLTSTVHKLAKDIQDHTSLIHKHFSYAAKKDGTVMLKDVIGSYNELLKLEEPIHKLASTLPFKNIVLTDASIVKSTEALGALIEELKTDETQNVAFTRELAIYTNEVAKACEAMTMCRFYMESIVKVYANIISVVCKNI